MRRHPQRLHALPASEHPPCVNLVQMADTFLPIPRYALTHTNV